MIDSKKLIIMTDNINFMNKFYHFHLKRCFEKLRFDNCIYLNFIEGMKSCNINFI